ncbi:MAG: hypothetical protein OJF49_003423 [Ktedonobacterales bacterium]|nr:MAG: hypothetical protein OJF49_003423 [Ktedonobacterales bacterium]
MLRDTLRRLAEEEPGDIPILSVYLDMRPQATGERPGMRAALVILKDRLREIEKTLWPRGPALDSFRADAARVEAYIEQEAPSEAQGLAIFSCSAHNLFETVVSGVPFETYVVYSRRADLFQLASLLEEQETSVVAVADTSTIRLFVMRRGFLREVEGVDEPNFYYSMRNTGGLNQPRYQRSIKNNRVAFAKEAAAELELLVDEVGAVRVVLAGDEVAIPLLRAALSPQVAQMTLETVPRFDIRAPRTEIEQEVAPMLVEAEKEDERALADQLLDAIQANGLGVAGLEPTRQALNWGQVDTLLLLMDAPISDDDRRKLVQQAVLTGAEVETVEQHEALKELGGVGALLRYRHHAPPMEYPAEFGQHPELI